MDQAASRLHALSLYSEEGAEYAKDTFNPSTLFNDKTQAEWFGNVVKNQESNALKAIIQSAQKPSKFLFLMIGLVGFFGGLMLFMFLSGGFGLGGTTPKTTHTTVIPPPPSVSGGVIHYGLSLISLLVSLVV